MTNRMNPDKRFIVTILAGGDGKRMQTVGSKVLCPFLGEPMIIRILKVVLSLQPNKILLVVGKHKDKIKDTIDSFIQDTFVIEYVDQPSPLGTGDAVNCCLPYYLETDRILILNGDMPCITREFLEMFLLRTSIQSCSMMVSTVENPYGYGRIVCDSGGEFQKIVEHKDCTEEEAAIKKINTGIYLVSGYLLLEYIPMISNDNFQKEYYLTDLFFYIKKYSKIPINIFKIYSGLNRFVYGVNTSEELIIAEQSISSL